MFYLFLFGFYDVVHGIYIFFDSRVVVWLSCRVFCAVWSVVCDYQAADYGCLDWNCVAMEWVFFDLRTGSYLKRKVISGVGGEGGVLF